MASEQLEPKHSQTRQSEKPAEVNLDEFLEEDEDEDADDRIKCSVSYVMICILLPTMAGLLNSFAWSGFSLYVRKNNWSLAMAGVGLSVGCVVRLLVQQVIFRLGIWTCAIFACLQGCIAILALLYPEEEAIIFCQAGSIPAFDVTVAIEGLTFDTWAHSEVMVGQAQSTVLSVFTIAYAMAATFGGVIYDFGGWTGVSVFHTVCSFGQLLVFVIQPAMQNSFVDFLRGKQAEDEEDEADDEVKELEEQATSIVPAPSASGPKGEMPQGDEPVLPGALEDEAPGRDSMTSATENPTVAGQVSTPLESRAKGRGSQDSRQPTPARGSAASRPRHSQRSQKSDRSEGSWRGGKRGRNSMDSEMKDHRKSLIGRNLARSSIRVGGHRASVASRFSAFSGFSFFTIGSHDGRRARRASQASRATRRSQLTQGTSGTGKTGQTGHTGQTGKTGQTKGSMGTLGTIRTVMTNISKFTSLSKSGENFQYGHGLQNALRPHIASRSVEMSIQSGSEDEDDDNERARRTKRQSEVRKKKEKGLPRDLYCVAFLIAYCAFNTNMSYGIEWQTFAIFFQEQHGWTNATWAGICQTAGDLLAGLVMGLLKAGDRMDLEELRGIRWLWHATTAHPHTLAIYCLCWAICNGGLCVPVLPVAIAAQVLMGTLFVFSVKAVTDMNLFYSLGNSKVFLQMQVQCKNLEAIGSLIAGALSFPLYEYNPIAPFFFAACMNLATCLLVLFGFCHRVGFGKDIETAEAERARRFGLKRESTWRSQRSIRAEEE